MRRKNHVEVLLNESDNFDAFITKSPANIAYLIGITFPFPDQSVFSTALVACKGNNLYTLILPVEWECVLKSFTWKGNAKTYSINEGSPDKAFRKALKSVIDDMKIADKKVAIDYSSWTAGELGYLKEICPAMIISNLDGTMQKMREIKSRDEIDRIQTAAHIADRGMIGALNHVEGTIGNLNYTCAEFLERVRVHAIEFGANYIGHLNLSQGRFGQSWYTPIHDLSLTAEGKTIRVDYTLAYNGCWTCCSRIFYTGKPDDNAVKAYAENMALKKYAVELLKPGIRVSDFCEAVRLKAEDEDIELLYEEGLGHGVGASENEWPFLTADNEEFLKTGMVIALDVKTNGSKDEMIHSVDIYELTEDGNRKLSDFRDWDTMYLINGVRSTH